jgi:hypothetical protein
MSQQPLLPIVAVLVIAVFLRPWCSHPMLLLLSLLLLMVLVLLWTVLVTQRRSLLLAGSTGSGRWAGAWCGRQ